MSFDAGHVIDESAGPARYGAPGNLAGWESYSADRTGAPAADTEMPYFDEVLDFIDEDLPSQEGARSAGASRAVPPGSTARRVHTQAGAKPRPLTNDAGSSPPQDIIELVTGHRQVPGS